MKKECKKEIYKRWSIENTEVIWDGKYLHIDEGEGGVSLTKSQTRKLYQKLASLYKD